MINCPYCGTENPADANECHNCSGDLTSLAAENASPPLESDTLAESSSPLPESTAPTMISSSAEVAAMLSGDEADKEPASEAEVPSAPEAASDEGEFSETPKEESPAEVTPDYAAPTMMSSSEEVAEMLTGAGAEKEAPSEPEPDAEAPQEETLAPEPADEVSPETVEEDSTPRKSPPPDLNAPTLIGIPDPLGSMSEEPPATKEEELPEPEFDETSISSPSTDTPPKKDNRWLYVLAGCGCLSIICVCVVVLSLIPYLQLQF
jgi:hypothetical protein